MTRRALVAMCLLTACRYQSPFVMAELVDIPATTDQITVDVTWDGRSGSASRALGTTSSASLSIELTPAAPQSVTLVFHADNGATPLAIVSRSVPIDGNGVYPITVAFGPASDGSMPADAAASVDLAATPDIGAPLWTLHNTGITVTPLFAIWGSSPTDLYTVGQAGIIYHSTDDAASWTQVTSGIQTNLFWVWGSGPNDVWAGGFDGKVLHRTTADFQQVNITGLGTETVDAIWSRGLGDVFVGASSGKLFHLSGGVFSAVALPSEVDMGAVSCVWGIGNTIYATTDNGFLLRTLTGDAPFTFINLNGTPRAVWGATVDDVWVAAENFGQASISHSTNASTGESFQPVGASPGDVALYGVWGSSSTNVFFVGKSGTIQHSTDGVTVADELSGAGDLNDVFGFDAAHVYVVGDSGVLRR